MAEVTVVVALTLCGDSKLDEPPRGSVGGEFEPGNPPVVHGYAAKGGRAASYAARGQHPGPPGRRRIIVQSSQHDPRACHPGPVASRATARARGAFEARSGGCQSRDLGARARYPCAAL